MVWTFVNMTSYNSKKLLPNAPAQNNFSALTVLEGWTISRW